MSQQETDHFELACALARENLGSYIQLMDPSYELAYHHEQIVKQLHRVEAGIDRRVIFQMPPRHGKSHTGTIFFPAWYLGRNPSRKVISASCTQDLADDFGSKVRNLIQDPVHQAIFPECRMSSDTQAKDHFRLTAGGEYFAVGRGSTTVGRGANCLAKGTLITTDRGDLPIEDLACRVGSIRVLTWNTLERQTEWRYVEAFRARTASVLYQIATWSGRFISATGEHPFFVGPTAGLAHWCPAEQLVSGHQLLGIHPDHGVSSDGVREVGRVAGPDQVFDIQVEGNHNFFANGLLTHNCFLIDDPTKDKIEARSPTIQEQMYDWFSTVARTRLEPPNAIIVTETLWSEAGLSAHLPRTQPNVGWKTLRFPAIAENDEFDENGKIWRKKGDPLWPSRFAISDLEEIRDSMRTDDWMCLFQQRATSEEGNYFKNEWLERSFLDRPTVGEGMNRYILVDPATSKKRGSDYTAMWVIGLGADRNYYPLAVVRDKMSLSERADMLFRLHGEWFPITNVGYEEYALSGDIAFIRERMERMTYNFTITPLGGGIRKEERIKELEPLFRTGRIRMPRYLPYRTVLGEQVDLMKPFLEEYRSFPNAAHDDMLDSLARITDKAMTLDWPMTAHQIERRAQAARQSSGRGSWMAA